MSDPRDLTEREKELLPKLTEPYMRRLQKIRDELEDKPYDELTKKEKIILKNIKRFTFIYNFTKGQKSFLKEETPKPEKKQKLTLEDIRSLMKKNVARLDPYEELFKAIETVSTV